MKTSNKSIKRCLLGAFVFMLALPGQAQDSLSMDVTFQGDLVIFLKDANKLPNWPETLESIVEIPSIKYSLIPNKQQVSIDPQAIEAVKVNVEPRLKKLYRGYVKAGFGLYTTPLVDFYYTDGRSRQGTWGVRYEHLSSAGGVAVNDSIPDAFSKNEINLWGRRFLKKHAIQGDFNWDRDVVNYYGFDPEINPINVQDFKEQRFNFVGGKMNLKSYYRDSSKMNYDGTVGFFNFRDNLESTENNIDIRIHGRKFVNKELISVDFGLNYDQFELVSLENPLDKPRKVNSLISLEPKATSIRENWKVSVGMGLWVDMREEQPFYFKPLVEAEYSLLDDLFIPYAGAGGMVIQNTYRSITEQNPWVLSEYDQMNTNQKNQLFGGIRGTISSSTSFNARISRTRYENFLYFVNDSTFTGGNLGAGFGVGNAFQTLYDDLTLVNLSGEVSINSEDRFKLFARGDYFIYNTEVEEYAWYQPTTQFTLSSSYDLRDKLIIKADVFTVGQRKAKTILALEEGQEIGAQGYAVVNLKAYVDANLGFEYRYTKRLSAWVQFNNFLASRYVSFTPFAAQRFNAMMGASYAF